MYRDMTLTHVPGHDSCRDDANVPRLRPLGPPTAVHTGWCRARAPRTEPSACAVLSRRLVSTAARGPSGPGTVADLGLVASQIRQITEISPRSARAGVDARTRPRRCRLRCMINTFACISGVRIRAGRACCRMPLVERPGDHRSSGAGRRGATPPRRRVGAAARRPVAGDRGAGGRATPGALRAAHRLGQVGGLLRRHRAAARGGRGRADGHRLAAARPDAQPGRGGRPRRHPRAHDQLRQPRRVGRDHRRGRRRRGRRAADQPGAAQQPRLPRHGAAQAGRDHRSAGGRRGTLRLRLGARLPARLPPPAHASSPTCPPARRCWPPPPPPTRGSPPTWPSSSATRWCCAARSTASRCGSRSSTCRRPPTAWAGWPTTSSGSTGSGIIYTLTVAAASETAAFLRSRGYAVAAYTGQSEDADRRAAEQDLLDNRIKALVATSALGMGFDKPDLGFVIHLGAPPSPIAYYQQVGRAGRAVDSADVLLLPGPEDAAIWRYFASLAFPPEEQVRSVLHALDAAGRPLSTPALEPMVDLRRTRLETDAQGARRRRRGASGSAAAGSRPGEPWVYDTARLRRVAQARTAEQDSHAGVRRRSTAAGWSSCAAASTTRAPSPCGRCDGCAGPRFTADVSPDALERGAGVPRAGRASRSRRRRCGRPGSSGWRAAGRQDRADEQALPGRAVGRLSDLGWGGRLRSLLAPDTPDVALPADVAGAVVEVLKSWAHGDDPWPARPVAVVAIASRRRPALVRSLAEHISTVGRLPLLGEVLPTAGAPPSGGGARGNSAQRVRALTAPSPCRPTSPRRSPPSTARSCWSTTWSTPAGR